MTLLNGQRCYRAKWIILRLADMHYSIELWVEPLCAVANSLTWLPVGSIVSEGSSITDCKLVFRSPLQRMKNPM